MPDDAQQLEQLIALARDHATVDMKTASALLGRSLNHCYSDARLHGAVAGISILRLSEKSIRIPSRPLLALLQIDDDPEATP